MRKKTKRRLKKIAAATCILSSVCIALYPFYKQQEKYEKIDKTNNDVIVEFTDNLPDKKVVVLDRKIEDSKHPENNIDQTENPYSPYRISTGEKIDGILYIESIDLELPIFSENTDENMESSVCKVPGTGIPGSSNYCIMGHNMRGYGVILNRLPEVNLNDEIIIRTATSVFHYKIIKSYVSKGLDNNILLPDNDGNKKLTIFACDDSIDDGRRIVIARLEKNT